MPLSPGIRLGPPGIVLLSVALGACSHLPTVGEGRIDTSNVPQNSIWDTIAEDLGSSGNSAETDREDSRVVECRSVGGSGITEKIFY